MGRSLRGYCKKNPRNAATGKEAIALTDTHATNEEMFLLKKLLKDVFLSDHVFCPLPEWEQIERTYLSTPLLQLTRPQTVQELLPCRSKVTLKTLKLILQLMEESKL